MFEVTARLSPGEGELDGFKQQAAELMRLARRRTGRRSAATGSSPTEPGARSRRATSTPTACSSTPTTSGRPGRSSSVTTPARHTLTLYGEPSPALADAMESLAGHVEFNRYSLLQGLDSDIQVPHEGRLRQPREEVVPVTQSHVSSTASRPRPAARRSGWTMEAASRHL